MQVTTPVALAGAADTAVFLAQRRQLFTEKPARALGSAAFGGLWLALAASSAGNRSQPGTATVVLAGSVAAANAVMVVVHLRHHVASPRVMAGAALSAVALADVLRRA